MSDRARRVLMVVLVLTAVALLLIPLLGGLVARSDEPVRSGLVGRAAPPISGTTLDGTPFDSGELAGQVVLVNVWASCPAAPRTKIEIPGSHSWRRAARRPGPGADGAAIRVVATARVASPTGAASRRVIPAWSPA